MTDTKKTTTNPQPQAPDYGEPWENGLYPNDIGDRYGHKVAQIGPKKTKHKDHIILCVNACVGIPSEDLTPSRVKKGMAMAKLVEAGDPAVLWNKREEVKMEIES